MQRDNGKTKVLTFKERGEGGRLEEKKANFCRLVRKVPSSKRVLEKGQEQKQQPYGDELF